MNQKPCRFRQYYETTHIRRILPSPFRSLLCHRLQRTETMNYEQYFCSHGRAYARQTHWVGRREMHESHVD
jgi:hypothetical protein